MQQRSHDWRSFSTVAALNLWSRWIKGDSKKESDETFYLDLFGNSGNSLFARNRGIGTILNDD